MGERVNADSTPDPRGIHMLVFLNTDTGEYHFTHGDHSIHDLLAGWVYIGYAHMADITVATKNGRVPKPGRHR